MGQFSDDIYLPVNSALEEGGKREGEGGRWKREGGRNDLLFLKFQADHEEKEKSYTATALPKPHVYSSLN